MVIYDHDYKTKTIKTEPKINKQQHIPQLFSSLEIICIKHSGEGFHMQEAHSPIGTLKTAKHNRRTSVIAMVTTFSKLLQYITVTISDKNCLYLQNQETEMQLIE